MWTLGVSNLQSGTLQLSTSYYDHLLICRHDFDYSVEWLGEGTNSISPQLAVSREIADQARQRRRREHQYNHYQEEEDNLQKLKQALGTTMGRL